jgi:methylenetetrahydrofolate dehydrogenase (NADP+)/methenyltetrahydrofolate cyclohydrolase
MRLLDGKKTADAIKAELAHKVALRQKQGLKTPHLAAVLIGNDGGSLTYVHAKVRACNEIGYKSTLLQFDEQITENELISLVEDLNNNDEIDGFIVQLPLPKHINELKITMAINPNKDVDGFHPFNLGKMVLGLPCFLPATPAGIVELLKRNEIETQGKHVVVVGRSNIVGTPLSILLSRNTDPGNCTVTLAHSKTINLSLLCQSADIIVAAIGRPNFITKEMVKPGAVVIDVGTTRIPDSSVDRGWKLSGDVAFDEVSSLASAITPVPGGVGPMTIVSLMMNTFRAMEFNGKN